MKNGESLKNFPFEALTFLRRLSKNNNRDWFEKNREVYESKLLKPAQAFVELVGIHLLDINPKMQAIPKIDKSIFRIHRDVRFSKNKAPYKTNLGIIFWEGPAKKMESSGLYFHIDTKNYFIATGMYEFTKDQLKRYRKIVAMKSNAEEIKQIIKKISRKGYKIGGKHYKQVPRGFDKEYKFADLLLHNGVYAFKEEKVNMLKGKDPIKFTVKVFKDLQPLHDWLIANLI